MKTTPYELAFGQPARQNVFPGVTATVNEEDVEDLLEEGQYNVVLHKMYIFIHVSIQYIQITSSNHKHSAGLPFSATDQPVNSPSPYSVETVIDVQNLDGTLETEVSNLPPNHDIDNPPSDVHLTTPSVELSADIKPMMSLPITDPIESPSHDMMETIPSHDFTSAVIDLSIGMKAPASPSAMLHPCIEPPRIIDINHVMVSPGDSDPTSSITIAQKSKKHVNVLMLSIVNL